MEYSKYRVDFELPHLTATFTLQDSASRLRSGDAAAGPQPQGAVTSTTSQLKWRQNDVARHRTRAVAGPNPSVGSKQGVL